MTALEWAGLAIAGFGLFSLGLSVGLAVHRDPDKTPLAFAVFCEVSALVFVWIA